VEARKSRWVEWKRIVVFSEPDEHVDDENEDVVKLCIVKEVWQYLGVGVGC